MARGYNRVIIMGNLARDPDVRFTPSKQKVARITVAIGRQWKNKTSGELQSHTDFVTVSAWNYVADICDRYLKKGRPVLVEGRLSVRDFDDAKTGQHRWVTEVVADNIVLLGSPRRDDEGMPSDSEPGFGNARMHSDAVSGGDMGSLREEEGFEDEFPLDFSEMGGTEGPGDVQIPF
ncbi:MAG: single-stranded DNA-binding protein [Synergistaceae bacterium]|jgi:single-strand DNA-binding protein|nr:single-stranded DNA-binding protein [Synergistaceae bacterium]NLL40449.1 single-stranded DNA-binding protein [Synergistaceae bacterium]